MSILRRPPLLSNELIIDAFERIREVVHKTVEGLNDDELTFRPTKSANSIAWLVWHLTRIQDDHIAELIQTNQVWSKGWHEKFALPFEEMATGYGHNADEVAAVRASFTLLIGYYDAVHAVTVEYIRGLLDKDYQKVIDVRWDPPVTLAVRLISIISDDIQHAGQASYIRGLLK